MEDHVFELEPATYLYDIPGMNLCELLIEENTLPDGFDQIYLIGDTFLAHYYSVYDYDANTLALGVNTHSEQLAAIRLPEELDEIQA